MADVGFHLVARGLEVREAPAAPAPAAVVQVRGAAPDGWPATGGTGAKLDGAWIGRTAPEEWTLIGPAALELAHAAASRLADSLHHFADVGSGRIAFAVAGSAARALLAQGCPIDLHARAFPPQAFAQTLFASVPALVRRTGDDAFEVTAEFGYAQHLRAWFARAAETTA